MPYFVTRLLPVTKKCIFAVGNKQMISIMSNKKNKPKIKEPIRLRFKPLANGNTSIYFDIYHEGKRMYEFPKYYLIPETSPIDKIRNNETLRLVKTLQAKRIIELQAGTFGIETKKAKQKANFLLYITTVAQRHFEKTHNKRGLYYNLYSLSFHLEQYKGNNITFGEIDKKFIVGFIDYLRTAKSAIVLKDGTTSAIAQNTANKLYHLLKSTLNKAVFDEIIDTNPCIKISDNDKPKPETTKKEYLTKEEVKKLIETNCNNDNLKRAFIFCCLTGIRFSDIRKIKFSDVKTDFLGKNIEFKQQKTRKPIIIQISNEALKWMPDIEGKPLTDYIFTLPKNESANAQLKRWCKSAGITKHITFHCSRHTAATLNITLGTPIEVVSKLLGHNKIATTQIYTKIVDEVQRSAVDKQNNIFDNV